MTAKKNGVLQKDLFAMDSFLERKVGLSKAVYSKWLVKHKEVHLIENGEENVLSNFL